jgi:2-polyprenyl-6-methoxyphenol hydroxylase-like FAD-dependent oxidoreductase
MKDRGLETLAGLQWRNLKGELLAELRGMMGSNGSGKMIFLGQHNLAGIILEHIAKYPNIKVIFSHRLVGLRQTDKEVTALFLTPEGEKFITAEYLAGCDGAGSAVRHCLCIRSKASRGPISDSSPPICITTSSRKLGGNGAL